MGNRPVLLPHRYLGQNYTWLKIVQRLQRRHWEDPLFPPNENSLGPRFANIPGIVWKRPWEISENARLYTRRRKFYQTAVIQGAVGNCWLITTIGLVAQRPDLMRRLVPFIKQQDWRRGKKRKKSFHPSVYRFQFYRMGRWVEVLVDDFLPYDTINDRLVFARSADPDEFWVSLLEKAYAKLLGSYSALETGSAGDAILDFTSAVVENWPTPLLPPPVVEYDLTPAQRQQQREEWERQLNVLWRDLRKHIQRGALISCAILPNQTPSESAWGMQHMTQGGQLATPDGLVISHSYGVLDAIEVGSVPFPLNLFPGNIGRPTQRLLLLMDPWGETTWRGRWALSANNDWQLLPWWQSVHLRNRANRQDGLFWISFEDFMMRFNVIQVGRRLNTKVFSFRRRWARRSFHDRWSGELGTAGGCTNFDGSVQGNPQYLIVVKHNDAEVLLSLQQGKRLKRRRPCASQSTPPGYHGSQEERTITATSVIMPEYNVPRSMQGNFVIGFIIMRVEENRCTRLEEPRDVVAASPYQNSREVTLRIRLPAGRYVLLPTTFAPGEEADFFLRVFSSPPIFIARLTQDGIEPPFWRRAVSKLTKYITHSVLSTRSIPHAPSSKPQPAGYLSIRIIQAVFPHELVQQRNPSVDWLKTRFKKDIDKQSDGRTYALEREESEEDGYDSDAFNGCLSFLSGPPFRNVYILVDYLECHSNGELNPARVQPICTRKARVNWKEGGVAVWNLEYLFSVFDPCLARVHLHVMAAMRLSRDERLGVSVLSVNRFATPEKAGTAWEMVLPIEPSTNVLSDFCCDDIPLQPVSPALAVTRHMVVRACYRPKLNASIS